MSAPLVVNPAVAELLTELLGAAAWVEGRDYVRTVPLPRHWPQRVEVWPSTIALLGAPHGAPRGALSPDRGGAASGGCSPRAPRGAPRRALSERRGGALSGAGDPVTSNPVHATTETASPTTRSNHRGG